MKSVFKLTVWLHTGLRPEHFQFSIFIGSGLELMIFHKMSPRTHSLRSKRFQSSYCAKVREETKKRLKGEGEGRRGNACPQTPRFWRTPLDISWFGSFVNWQLVKIEISRTDYPWISRFVKLLCSLTEHVAGDCKNCNKKDLR